jgi:uncharacterized damage-inducible protein DinB
MNRSDVQLLLAYNRWGNARILGAAAKLTDEQFLAFRPFPHGGLRGTLVHELFAEWTWRMRWQGTPSNHDHRPRPEEIPTLSALHARWMEEEASLMDLVAGLTDEKLSSTSPRPRAGGTDACGGRRWRISSITAPSTARKPPRS